ncbi:patatin-like phospholipase family protein [bacterium]|nr:patatin-like phospholipase family protein [bacterium]
MRCLTAFQLLLIFVFTCHGEIITPNFNGYEYPPGLIAHKKLNYPKIGLALSGGGLRGLAHAGVLAELHENGIKPDYIAGVSIGAIIGSLYALGYTSNEITETASHIDWGDIFVDKPSRSTLFLNRKKTHGRHLFQVRFKGFQPHFPSAFISGQKLTMALYDIYMDAVYKPDPGFDNLKIPFRAPVTDLKSGELIVKPEGDLMEVVRASASFPLLFSPIAMDGRIVIDGGIVENVPVTTVKKMGADYIIAVDVSSPLTNNVEEPWEIANQVTTIMMRNETESSLESADLVLKPVPESAASFDFSLADSLILWGRKCVRDSLASIVLNQHKPEIEDQKQFNFKTLTLYLNNTQSDVPDSLKSLLTGGTVSRSIIVETLTNIYKVGIYSDIQAAIENDTTISIYLTTNPHYKFVVFKGNNLIPDSILQQAVKSPPNKPLNYDEGLRDRENIIRLYRNKGYALSEIEETSLSDDTLTIVIDEGKIKRLGVEGGPHSALNDLGLVEGAVFNWNTARRGVNRLYGTDLYSAVRLRTIKVKDGYKVTLILEPHQFPLLRAGARYGIERKGSIFAEFITDALPASGIGLTIFAAPGEKDARYQVELSSDRILRTYLAFNLAAYHRRHEYKLFDSEPDQKAGYDYEINGAKLQLGQQLYRWGFLSAAYKFDRALSSHPDDNPDQKLSTIVLESQVDTYDRYPFPRSGTLFRFTFQSSGEYTFSDAEYSKFSAELQKWLKLRHRWYFNLRLRGGYAEPTVPSWEQFELGGLNDFFGLHHREYTGNQLVAGSLGLRFDLLSRFLADAFVTVRYDFAQIVQDADEIEFKSGYFRQGIGLMFSLNTLLGPVNFAWGWAAPYENIKVKKIEGQNVLYFSIGHDF